MPSYIDQMQEAYSNELYHHGVKGQKWGVRRYQNYDGTRTEAGKKHEADSSYGTHFGDGRRIKQEYKAARRAALLKDSKHMTDADAEVEAANSKTKAALKAGKISKKEAKAQYDKNYEEASKNYAKKSTYDKDINKAKADYHANRARMFENRSNEDMKYGLNWWSDKSRAKANREKLRSDVYNAKASGDKEAIKKAKSALRKTNMAMSLAGTDRVGAYQRYKENGASTVKAAAKVYFGGNYWKK